MNRLRSASASAQRELRNLGEHIAIVRKVRSMTQSDLARASGCTPGTVRRLEQGDAGVTLRTLAMVLQTLGQREVLGRLLDGIAQCGGIPITADQLPQRVRRPRLAEDARATGGPTESTGDMASPARRSRISA